ncbi:MAG: hypothetical protein ACP5NV_04465 [Candidatus Woesearchaeota archaeon]
MDLFKFGNLHSTNNECNPVDFLDLDEIAKLFAHDKSKIITFAQAIKKYDSNRSELISLIDDEKSNYFSNMGSYDCDVKSDFYVFLGAQYLDYGELAIRERMPPGKIFMNLQDSFFSIKNHSSSNNDMCGLSYADISDYNARVALSNALYDFAIYNDSKILDSLSNGVMDIFTLKDSLLYVANFADWYAVSGYRDKYPLGKVGKFVTNYFKEKSDNSKFSLN